MLSPADSRRPLLAAAALREFGRGGYHRTTVADTAREAKVSPVYVFKLYRGKCSRRWGMPTPPSSVTAPC
nr:helix-turn-helix domain-containing protein [Microbacterium sp. ABRD28]